MGLIIVIGIIVLIIILSACINGSADNQDELNVDDDSTNPDNPMYEERQEELFDDYE